MATILNSEIGNTKGISSNVKIKTEMSLSPLLTLFVEVLLRAVKTRKGNMVKSCERRENYFYLMI